MSKPTNSRKQNLTYYFSVEGETEYWYLKWLEGQIKASGTAKHTITIKPEVAEDPVSYVKKLVIQRKTTIWHLSDIEGSTPGNIQAVQNTLSRLKAAKSLGKSIDYKYGYSNLSFDLYSIASRYESQNPACKIGAKSAGVIRNLRRPSANHPAV